MGNLVKNSASTINPDSAVICLNCIINLIEAFIRIKKVLAQYEKSAIVNVLSAVGLCFG